MLRQGRDPQHSRLGQLATAAAPEEKSGFQKNPGRKRLCSTWSSWSSFCLSRPASVSQASGSGTRAQRHLAPRTLFGQRSMEVFPSISSARTPTPLLQNTGQMHSRKITVSCLALLLDGTQESVFHLWKGLKGSNIALIFSCKTPRGLCTTVTKHALQLFCLQIGGRWGYASCTDTQEAVCAGNTSIYQQSPAAGATPQSSQKQQP